MLVKKLKRCAEIVANDGCRLREVLHPERDGVDLPFSQAVAWVDPGEATHPHRFDSNESLSTQVTPPSADV